MALSRLPKHFRQEPPTQGAAKKQAARQGQLMQVLLQKEQWKELWKELLQKEQWKEPVSFLAEH
jgi:hypothetical protein